MPRIIIAPAGLPAFVAECTSPWDQIKDRIGRSAIVEAVGLEDGVVVLCDEEAQFKDLPVNRQLPVRMPELPTDMEVINVTGADLLAPGEMGVHRIHGDFVLTRYAGEVDWNDLTQEDVDRYLPILNGQYKREKPLDD